MGDGLHREADGKWISKEYKRVLKALGITTPRINNSIEINRAVLEVLKTAICFKCKGRLKQSRSGSLRAICLDCGAKFQLKRKKK